MESCGCTAAGRAGTSGRRLTQGLPQSDCYVNVLRDAMAVDSLDSCGVYFGTTGGQVYASADAGDNWAPIVRDLPAGAFGGGADAAMIRVVLPAHLRTLARMSGEVELEVEGRGHAAVGAGCAGGPFSDAAGHHSRPCHAAAAAVFAIFRLRGGFVARAAGRAVAGGGGGGGGAVFDFRGDRGRVVRGEDYERDQHILDV